MNVWMKTMRGAALALLLIPAGLVGQQTQPTPSLTVNAVGSVDKEPEQGVVLLAVESEAATAKVAADANAARMSQLIPALRRAGVAERNIRTVSYNLQPEYVPQTRDGPPRIAKYRAINMVRVTVDTVARLGSVIDIAIASGANRVENISFQLRDYHAAHLEAVRIATRNARREAEVVAEAAGERLGQALSINTGGYSPAPPQPLYRQMADMAAQAPATPIEGGTLTIVANVNIVYELLRGPPR